MGTEFSGKFVLRVNPRLHQTLVKEARARGLSLNEICIEKLADHHSAALVPASTWNKLVTLAQKQWGPRLLGILVFGSYARGELTTTSDIDLLFVMASGEKIGRRLYREFDLIIDELGENGFSHPLSPQFALIPHSFDELGGLWLEIALASNILWEKEPVLSQTLTRLRQEMLEGRWRRRISHGHPYWIKNIPR